MTTLKRCFDWLAMRKFPAILPLSHYCISLVMSASNCDSIAVIVDPISTGLHVTKYCQDAGFKCVALFSIGESTAMDHFAVSLSEMSFEAQLKYTGDPENSSHGHEDPALMKIVEDLKKLPYRIEAVFPGCETGVTLAERLASTLGVRSNGMEKIVARRDKYHMAGAVAASGIRSVRQTRPETWEEVEQFVKEVNPSPFRIIMKPSNSAGSDGVVCCRSMEDVRARWDLIKNSEEVNVLGQPMDVLVQEYLQGTEYVVNGVSRNGVHKITCIWRQEKQALNGGDFTYLASRLVKPATENEDGGLWRALVEYNNKMLDALDIMNGASHAEIVVRTRGDDELARSYPRSNFIAAGVTGAVAAGAAAALRSRSSLVSLSAAALAGAAAYSLASSFPSAISSPKLSPFDICLIEVGSRCQGAEGTFIPIADHCIGYNQAKITASAYLDGDEFHSIPHEPTAVSHHGVLVWLVSYEAGTFRGLCGEDKIRALPSFLEMTLDVKEGGHIYKTVDVMSVPGSVKLAHKSEEQMEADLAAIRDMERDGLFIVEETVVA